MKKTLTLKSNKIFSRFREFKTKNKNIYIKTFYLRCDVIFRYSEKCYVDFFIGETYLGEKLLVNPIPKNINRCSTLINLFSSCENKVKKKKLCSKLYKLFDKPLTIDDLRKYICKYYWQVDVEMKDVMKNGKLSGYKLSKLIRSGNSTDYFIRSTINQEE